MLNHGRSVAGIQAEIRPGLSLPVIVLSKESLEHSKHFTNRVTSRPGL
jgi:hypothetical protein